MARSVEFRGGEGWTASLQGCGSGTGLSLCKNRQVAQGSARWTAEDPDWGQELPVLKGDKSQDDLSMQKSRVGVRLSFPSGPQRKGCMHQIHPRWELKLWFRSGKDRCGHDP